MLAKIKKKYLVCLEQEEQETDISMLSSFNSERINEEM